MSSEAKLMEGWCIEVLDQVVGTVAKNLFKILSRFLKQNGCSDGRELKSVARPERTRRRWRTHHAGTPKMPSNGLTNKASDI